MNNLNTILIEGTLTKDPILKALSATSFMCQLSIANNRYYTDKDGNWKQETSFFLVQVYGGVAETCAKYLKKGRGIRVVGRAKQIQFAPENGIRRDLFVIVAEHIEFQPKKETVKPENIPEPDRIPGELNTTADMESLQTTEYVEESPQACTVDTSASEQSTEEGGNTIPDPAF